MTPLLKVRSISMHFGPMQTRHHALVWDNGGGKSTLMENLVGVQQELEGEVFSLGREFDPHSPGEGRGLGTTMRFQELSLHSNLTTAENILANCAPGTSDLIHHPFLNDLPRQSLKGFICAVQPGSRVGGVKAISLNARRLGCTCKEVLSCRSPRASVTCLNASEVGLIGSSLRGSSFAGRFSFPAHPRTSWRALARTPLWRFLSTV